MNKHHPILRGVAVPFLEQRDTSAWGDALFQGIPPSKFRPRAAQFNKKERRADACPSTTRLCQSCIASALSVPIATNIRAIHFAMIPQEKLHIRVNRREGYKDGEMKCCRGGKCRRRPKAQQA